MASPVDIPVFDADNHLYETREAFTKFLPDRYKSAIEYVDVDGRTKISVRGTISDYIPNPTFDVVARPGAQEEYYRRGNPEGLAEPASFAGDLSHLPQETVAKIMGGNLARLMRVEVAQVARLMTLVSPTAAR